MNWFQITLQLGDTQPHMALPRAERNWIAAWLTPTGFHTQCSIHAQKSHRACDSHRQGFRLEKNTLWRSSISADPISEALTSKVVRGSLLPTERKNVGEERCHAYIVSPNLFDVVISFFKICFIYTHTYCVFFFPRRTIHTGMDGPTVKLHKR